MPRRGIGKAIAKGFADAGASVMLSSRKLDGLEAAAAEIGGDVAVFAAHAGKPADGEACIDATIERFGGLDILVNNAGANPYYGFTLDVDEARYDKTFEVNLRGPLFWSQVAYRKAFKEKPGVIINIASVGGLRTEFGLGVYNITKAALIHLTRQLAGEIAPTRVIGIAPGLVKTDFADHLVQNFGDRPRRPHADAAARRARGHRQPRHVPGQRQGELDHRRHLRHRRRRRGRPATSEPCCCRSGLPTFVAAMTARRTSDDRVGVPHPHDPGPRAGARVLPRRARRARSATRSRRRGRPAYVGVDLGLVARRDRSRPGRRPRRPSSASRCGSTPADCDAARRRRARPSGATVRRGARRPAVGRAGRRASSTPTATASSSAPALD